MCENICIGIEGEGLKGRKLRMREREKKNEEKECMGKQNQRI